MTPLREGGSCPAIVEGSDDGLYVLKLRGAAQGVKALIAELIAGELGRAIGLDVPELALMELDAAIGRSEPDAELRDLLKASVGLNVALDYLPGSVMFDAAARLVPTPEVASRIVWFDAFITNVDRTARNPNLLWWHRKLWLIDHGAALYFHHAWDDHLARAQTPFPAIKDHVLLPWATKLAEAAAELVPRMTPAVVDAALVSIPDAWLSGEGRFSSPAEHRAAYREYLLTRVQSSPLFVAEAVRAYSHLL